MSTTRLIDILAIGRVRRALTALTVLVGVATAQTSVKNGAWDDATVWNTASVPGAGAAVVIAHTVGLRGPQFPGWWASRNLGAGTLMVLGSGELIPTWPNAAAGETLSLTASAITVLPGGVIRGQNASSQPGAAAGGVHLAGSYLPVGTVSTLLNQGMIFGGAGGARGGNVFIDYFGAVGPVAGLVTNEGQILGGDGSAWPLSNTNGGQVVIFAGAVINDGAPFLATGGGLIQGGTGYLSGRGGNVWVHAMLNALLPAMFVNTGGGLIQGGNNPFWPGQGGNQGGSVRIFSQGAAIHLLPSVIAPGPCGAVSFFGVFVFVTGVIVPFAPGLAGPCSVIWLDPPDGVFEGDTEIRGQSLNFSAAQLRLGPFNLPSAIHADANLDITVAPGGTLDLSGLSLTPQVTAGTSITVRADTIVLPPGATSINQVMSPPPLVSAGAQSFHVGVAPPSFEEDVTCGTPFEITVVASNLGNMWDTLDLSITDSQGWLVGGPVQLSVPLAAMDAHVQSIVLQPNPAQQGGATDVFVTLSSPAGASVSENATYRVSWYCPPVVLDCQLLPTATQGCNSLVSYAGLPSATLPAAFTVTFGGLNAQVNGVVFYGILGPQSATWSPQSNLCVKSVSQRLNGIPGASGNSNGTNGLCDGQYSFDFNAIIQGAFPGLLGAPIAEGQQDDIQDWQRDPVAAKTTNLTDSLSFQVGP